MGLTAGCAVCHDHKYDPLSTREFYSLYSFFNSAADPAMDKNIKNTDPYFKLTSDEQKAALATALAAENEAKRLLEEAAGRVDYRDPASEESPPEVRPITDVWLDDIFPLGAKVTCSSRNMSIWETVPAVEPQMGRRSLRQAGAANYQDKFENPTQPLVIPAKAVLSVWVRVDEDEVPQAALRCSRNRLQPGKSQVPVG